jgi:DNA polymerase III alpha subunit
LGHTKGVLLFQEQILRIAREIAGLTWGEADLLRRGVAFRPDEMARVRERFLAGCLRRASATATNESAIGPGLTQQQAETLWEQIAAFAGYGFNQGHATAYAEVSYRSAYVKARWPAAFLCARLANGGGFHYAAIYVAEAVRLGISVRPPHVNHSGNAFTLGHTTNGDGTDRPILWMGLGQVRDLRQVSIEQILTEKERQKFADLRDFLRRVSLQPREITHLIQCGALDGLAENRAVLLAEAEEIRQAGSATQLAFAFARPRVAPEAASQRLAWERHVLGYPITVNPVDLLADQLPEHTPLRLLPAWPRRWITAVGVRLPGWTGGKGFFLWDGDWLIIVERETPPPAPWRPLVVRGHWMSDGYGTFWLQAEDIRELSDTGQAWPWTTCQ